MKLKIQIDVDNDSMRYHREGEEHDRIRTSALRCLFREITSDIDTCRYGGKLMDANGNTVGHWAVEEDDGRST